MEITFNAESVSIDSNYRTSEISLTIEANGREVAEKLDLDDRLYDLCPVDVADEIGRDKMLDAIGEEDILKWAISNIDHNDILEFIGLDKIHEYLSHEE